MRTPDLFVCGYFLFPKFKRTRVVNVEVTETAVIKFPESIEKIDLQLSFEVVL